MRNKVDLRPPEQHAESAGRQHADSQQHTAEQLSERQGSHAAAGSSLQQPAEVATQLPVAWEARELSSVLQTLTSPELAERQANGSHLGGQSIPAGGSAWYTGRCVHTSATQLSGLTELMASLEAIMGGGQMATGTRHACCCMPAAAFSAGLRRAVQRESQS